MATPLETEELQRSLAALQRRVAEQEALIARLMASAERAEPSVAGSAAAPLPALLHEVNHRVKNNLAVIIGLIQMTARRANAEPALTTTEIKELVGRIQSLATVHSLLAAVEWGNLRLSTLVRQIAEQSVRSHGAEQALAVLVAESPATVTPSQAHHLALIVHELALNALKHGLSPGPGPRQLRFAIEQAGDRLRLTVADDGPGYPPAIIALDATAEGVGLPLIRNLTRRSLRGELSLANAGGAVATLTIPNFLTADRPGGA